MFICSFLLKFAAETDAALYIYSHIYIYMLKKPPPRAPDGLNVSYQMCTLSKGTSRPPLLDNLIFTDYLKVIQNIYTLFPFLSKRCFNYHAPAGVINCVLIQNQIKNTTNSNPHHAVHSYTTELLQPFHLGIQPRKPLGTIVVFIFCNIPH